LKILVTGVTGYIGQSIMPTLTMEFKKNEFLTVSRNIYKANILFPKDKFRNVTNCAINDSEFIVKFNPDVVIHLAGYSTSSNATDEIKKLINGNIEFGVNLLDTLRQCNNVKYFFNISSFSEYKFEPFRKSNAYLYSASKSAYRNFLEYYAAICGFNYMNVVLYSIYGGKNMGKRVVEILCNSTSSVDRISMSPGEQLLDFTHVEDVSSFFSYAIKNIALLISLNPGEDFHLGTGQGTTIKQLANYIELKNGVKCNVEWGKLPYRDTDIMKAIAPLNQNNSLIKWKTTVNIKTGIK
jgi:CDP-paratose synthetase